jgi:hypothetical protein
MGFAPKCIDLYMSPCAHSLHTATILRRSDPDLALRLYEVLAACSGFAQSSYHVVSVSCNGCLWSRYTTEIVPGHARGGA